MTGGLQIPMMMLISSLTKLDGTLDPLAAFINELEGPISMIGPDTSDIIDDLLVQQQRDIESMTVNNVVVVRH